MTHLFQIIQEKATLIYLKNLSPIFSRISCELTEIPAPWTFLKGQLLSSTTGGQGAAGGKMYTCGTWNNIESSQPHGELLETDKGSESLCLF